MQIKNGITRIFIANMINLIFSLFTGFVLPKFLSIETYSNIKLFQLYVSYIGFVSLGYADGVYLRLGGKNIDLCNKNEIAAEFSTYKIFQFILWVIFILISFLLKNEILFFTSIVILPVNIVGYLRNIYQATGKFDLYSKILNINTILLFFVNIFILFIIKSDNYFLYILGYTITYFLYWIYVEYQATKIIGRGKVIYNYNHLKNNIRSGFTLMIGNFCSLIFTSIDRLFVQYLMGAIKFAYYSFAVGVENLLNVFVTPISSVMYNYLCNHKEKNDVIELKRILMFFATFIIIIIFPVKFIVNLWIDKYSPSLNVLLFLILTQYILILIKCIHINLYKALKKQHTYFLVMILIVVLSVILNIIFYILFKSMLAIAIATLITNIIWFIVGEIKLKEYMLKSKDYLYFFIIMIVYILCFYVKNTILGCIIYISVAFIISVLFINKTVKRIFIEIEKFWKTKIIRN